MGQVERTLGVLHDAEVKGLDADGGIVGATVAGRKELSTTETGLDIGGARGENRVITENS